MNKNWRILLVTAAIISVSLAGCMGKVKYPTYYTLNLGDAIGSSGHRCIGSSENQLPAAL